MTDQIWSLAAMIQIHNINIHLHTIKHGQENSVPPFLTSALRGIRSSKLVSNINSAHVHCEFQEYWWYRNFLPNWSISLWHLISWHTRKSYWFHMSGNEEGRILIFPHNTAHGSILMHSPLCVFLCTSPLWLCVLQMEKESYAVGPHHSCCVNPLIYQVPEKQNGTKIIVHNYIMPFFL